MSQRRRLDFTRLAGASEPPGDCKDQYLKVGILWLLDAACSTFQIQLSWSADEKTPADHGQVCIKQKLSEGKERLRVFEEVGKAQQFII